MIVASGAYYPWRHYGSWPAYAILLGGPVTALWLVALVALERPRLAYLLYAFINLSLYAALGLWCLMVVTGDSF
jgi:hypothetical protein